MLRPFSSALLAVVFVAACSHQEQTPVRRTVDAPVGVVRRSSIPTLHAAAGTVRSRTTSTLSANSIGTVTRVAATEGMAVRAGDVLVEIDPRENAAGFERARAGQAEVERAIEGAAANASLAESTWQRYAALHQRGSASTQELDEARARRDGAAAELARMRARRGEAGASAAQAAAALAYRTVRSPIDGVVTARFIDAGAQAAPGVPLLTVEDTKAMRVETTAPEGVSVNVGDRVMVEVGGERRQLPVTEVQPSLDAGSRSSLVKVDLDRPVRSGSFARVWFAIGHRDAVNVPSSALVRRGQLTGVFAVSDGVARLRLLTLGQDLGSDRIEVLSGLSDGDSIVLQPKLVHDGDAIGSGE
jgi:RND family efflux transporter MFP subunit